MTDERLADLIEQRDGGVSAILASKRELLDALQAERAEVKRLEAALWQIREIPEQYHAFHDAANRALEIAREALKR
jgi:hypothetical protein